MMLFHVDYAPHLDAFYRVCGFQPTAAGLIRLERATGDAARQPAVPQRAIVVFPNPDDLRPILPFRSRWDPLAALVPPHLTLVFPFRDLIGSDDLRAHVVHVIRDVEPFPIRLSGVTASEGEYLFLNVKQGNDALIALHDRLYTGPLEPHLSRRHTFVPHLTVGRVADRHGFETALAEAAASPVALETMVRAVSIYAIDADGTRRTAANLPLRHTATGG